MVFKRKKKNTVEAMKGLFAIPFMQAVLANFHVGPQLQTGHRDCWGNETFNTFTFSTP
jgi:hypothetical protein